MVRRNPKLYLQDILISIEAIEEYTRDLTETNFYRNGQVQDAVIRRLEIIGEAVKSLEEEFRQRYPNLPWKNMAGMRDVLIHQYFGVDLRRVWLTIKRDLPAIKREISEIQE